MTFEEAQNSIGAIVGLNKLGRKVYALNKMSDTIPFGTIVDTYAESGRYYATILSSAEMRTLYKTNWTHWDVFPEQIFLFSPATKDDIINLIKALDL